MAIRCRKSFAERHIHMIIPEHVQLKKVAVRDCFHPFLCLPGNCKSVSSLKAEWHTANGYKILLFFVQHKR